MDRDLIHELKKKWGRIYLLDIRGQDYVIRPLKFDEFDSVAFIFDSEWDSADAEESIVETGVVYPESFDINKTRAGIVTSLAQEILMISGFLPNNDKYTKDILTQKRAEMREFRNMMKAFIIAAMPSYRDTDLDECTYEQLAYKQALAEKIIAIQQEAYGMEPTDLRLQITNEQPDQPQFELSEEEILEGKPPPVDPIAQKLHQALL